LAADGDVASGSVTLLVESFSEHGHADDEGTDQRVYNTL
jgi:hypothetical protein